MKDTVSFKIIKFILVSLETGFPSFELPLAAENSIPMFNDFKSCSQFLPLPTFLALLSPCSIILGHVFLHLDLMVDFHLPKMKVGQN